MKGSRCERIRVARASRRRDQRSLQLRADADVRIVEATPIDISAPVRDDVPRAVERPLTERASSHDDPAQQRQRGVRSERRRGTDEMAPDFGD